MFYQQDLLTDKKHGLAIVWLAATLGERTTFKKLQKKDVMSVNVVKTCEFLQAPTEPMALRMSSSLMIGVTRVYARQYQHLLADASQVQQHLRTAIFAAASSAYSGSTTRANTELANGLLLPDDPAFNPELIPGNGGDALPDLSALDMNLGTFDFGNVSPLSAPRFSTNAAFRNAAALAPLSPLAASNDPILQLEGFAEAAALDDPPSMQDISFQLAEDGALIELRPSDDGVAFGSAFAQSPPSTQQALPPIRSPSVNVVQQRFEHRSDARPMGVFEDLELAETAQSPIFQAATAADNDFGDQGMPMDVEPPADVAPSHQAEVRLGSTEQPNALAGRSRRRQAIVMTDIRTELQAAEVISWRDSYAARMEERQAKRRRLHDTFTGADPARWLTNPTAAVIHPSLVSMLDHTTAISPAVGVWHSPQSPVGDQSWHAEEQQSVRAGDLAGELEMPEPFILEDQTIGLDVEMARRAPAVIEDGGQRQSLTQIFPWNVTAGDTTLQIERGRQRQTSMSLQDMTAAGRFPVLDTPSMRRASLLPGSRGSARPVSVAGRILEDSEYAPQFEQLDEPSSPAAVGRPPQMLPLQEVSEDSPEARSNRPPADVLSPARHTIQQESVTASYLLDQRHEEERRFHEFVGQRWAPSESVTFRELIPRGNNTLVAAHAFTHVLALASVSAFRVRQAAPYDDIYIDRF